MLAEGVKLSLVEGDGDELVTSGYGFSQRKAFVVDEGAVACIVATYAIHPASVASQHVAKVFDGAGLQQSAPGFVAAARPVGADEQQVVVEIVG